MIDFKRTIKNLHNRFPEFTLDQLIGIMESIEFAPILNIPSNVRDVPNRDDYITWSNNKTCIQDPYADKKI